MLQVPFMRKRVLHVLIGAALGTIILAIDLPYRGLFYQILMRLRGPIHPHSEIVILAFDVRGAEPWAETLTKVLAPPPPGYFFPEPLRSVGGALLRRAIVRCEGAEEDGVNVPGARLLKRLPDVTVPRRLEPRPLGKANS